MAKAAAVGKQRSGHALTALMFGAGFVVNLAVSIVAPMLPGYLHTRNILPSGPAGGMVQGLLFSASSVTTLVITPIHPAVVKRVGYIVECGVGMAVFACGMSSFGSAGWIADLSRGNEYSSQAESTNPCVELGLLFLFRVTAAAGGTLAMLSATAVAMQANPDNKGALMGASETAIGIGFAVGPSFGAAFYTQFGFQAPFLAASAVALGLFPLLGVAARATAGEAAQAAPGEGAHGAAEGHGRRRLSPWSSLSAVVVGITGGMTMFVFGWIDPTLAPLERDVLGASMAGVGVLFSCASFPYALLGSVIGAVVDAVPHRAGGMLVFGGAGLGVAMATLPPVAPFMGTWAWQMLVLLAFGVVSAFAMVPAVPLVHRVTEVEAHKRGCAPCDEDALLSFAYTFFTLGELAGPLCGSSLAGTFGYESSYQGLGLFTVAFSLLAAALLASGGHLCGSPAPSALAESMLTEADSPALARSPMRSNSCLLRASSGDGARLKAVDA